MKKENEGKCSAILSHVISAVLIEEAKLKKGEHIELSVTVYAEGFSLDCRRQRDN